MNLISLRKRGETLGWAVSIILIIWFVYRTLVLIPTLPQPHWNYQSLLIILSVMFLYIVTLINGSFVSFGILRSIAGKTIDFPLMITICLISQIAKYLPGNIAHHIGRVILSRKLLVPRKKVIIGIFIETVWVIGIVMCLTIYHGLSIGNDFFDEHSVIAITLSSGGIIIGLYLLKGLALKLYNQFLCEQEFTIQKDLKLPNVSVTILSLATYFFNYLLLGAIISLLGGATFGLWELNILTLGSIFAVAWVVGFFTPGSPAGIGVREFILLELLTPFYGSEVALALTILLRLTTILGDVIAWVIGVILWSKFYKSAK